MGNWLGIDGLVKDSRWVGTWQLIEKRKQRAEVKDDPDCDPMWWVVSSRKLNSKPMRGNCFTLTCASHLGIKTCSIAKELIDVRYYWNKNIIIFFFTSVMPLAVRAHLWFYTNNLWCKLFQNCFPKSLMFFL